MTRLVVTLSKAERQALGMLAQEEFRDPREQVRYILRQELHRRGFLSLEHESEKPDESEKHDTEETEK